MRKVYLVWENEQRIGYDRHDLMYIYADKEEAARVAKQLNDQRPPNSDKWYEAEDWEVQATVAPRPPLREPQRNPGFRRRVEVDGDPLFGSVPVDTPPSDPTPLVEPSHSHHHGSHDFTGGGGDSGGAGASATWDPGSASSGDGGGSGGGGGDS